MVSVVCLGHRSAHDVNNEDAPLMAVFLLLGLFAALGFTASSLLAFVYEALPERWLEDRRGRLAAVTVGLAVLATAGCVPAMSAAYAAMPWQSAWFVQTVPYWSSIYFFVVFVIWSAVFHGVRYRLRFRRARERLAEVEALARDAQLEALRLQLNPHFFFNALNSVIGLVEVDPRQAQDMMRRLAALMRRTLDGASFELVRLDEELDFVREYLRCEEIRFRDKLEVAIDAPASLAMLPVPGMLLQPLVENAIKHGLKRGATLRLRLVARAAEGVVMLEVRNSGSLAAKGTGGTGLRLVRERLAAQFPESGELKIREEEGWVVARVRYAPTEGSGEPAPRLERAVAAMGVPMTEFPAE